VGLLHKKEIDRERKNEGGKEKEGGKKSGIER